MEAKIENRIQEILGKRQMTQIELAKLSGLPDASVNRIVKGHQTPSTVTVFKICKALSLPVEKVFQLRKSKSI